MHSLVRDEVQRKVDISCRQCQAKVDDYIGSSDFLDTLQHAFLTARFRTGSCATTRSAELQRQSLIHPVRENNLPDC